MSDSTTKGNGKFGDAQWHPGPQPARNPSSARMVLNSERRADSFFLLGEQNVSYSHSVPVNDYKVARFATDARPGSHSFAHHIGLLPRSFLPSAPGGIPY